MKSFRTLLIGSLLLPGGFPLAAQRSVGKRISGEAEARARDLEAARQSWVGGKFVFLEKPKAEQKEGYRGFCESENCPLIVFSKLDYRAYVGKTLTALSVAYTDSGVMVVKFQLEAGPAAVYGTPSQSGDWIAGIAPAGDLERAKARWLGKTVYATAATKSIATYDAERNEYGAIPVQNLEPLKVIDVWRGFDANRAVWLIVERRNGEQGFIATSVSWTKSNRFWRENSRPGEREVHDADPRTRFSWPPSDWQAIAERSVHSGMTREQVLMSWGEPLKMERAEGLNGLDEQWTYPDQVLVFVGTRLK